MLTNFFLFKIGGKLKYEMLAAFTVLAAIIFMPLIAVVVISNAGVAAVSSALVTVNPVSHLIDIFDSNGNKVGEMQLSTIWPAKGKISDTFGTLDSVRQAMGLKAHTGIDIMAHEGTPITPFTAGKITEVHNKNDNSCGIYVRVDHGTNITSLYCHMIRTNTVVGAEAKPGDVIGYVGTTGASTGNHAHFQININGIPVNPILFMVGLPEPQ